jgi:malate permease and related proteins
MSHLQSFAKVLPVLLVIGLGASLRRFKVLGEGTARELKKLVVNITLPPLLFLAFARLDAQVRYLGVVVVLFGACLAGFLVGKLLQPLTRIQARTFPVLMTGFEAGMMGYALYAAIYGASNVHKIALMDLGHLIFVYTILIPMLERGAGARRPLAEQLRGIARTPVLVAIVAGLIVGQSGLMAALGGYALAGGLLDALALVGSLTAPLVALLVGFDLRLELRGLSRPALTVALRLAFWIPVSLLIVQLVLRRWLGLDDGYVAALMVMIVLPPPFVYPIFMPASAREDLDYTVNTLALATVVTLGAVTAVAILFPA